VVEKISFKATVHPSYRLLLGITGPLLRSANLITCPQTVTCIEVMHAV